MDADYGLELRGGIEGRNNDSEDFPALMTRWRSASGRTAMWTPAACGAFETASHPADTAHTAATEGLNGLSLAVHPYTGWGITGPF